MPRGCPLHLCIQGFLGSLENPSWNIKKKRPPQQKYKICLLELRDPLYSTGLLGPSSRSLKVPVEVLEQQTLCSTSSCHHSTAFILVSCISKIITQELDALFRGIDHSGMPLKNNSQCIITRSFFSNAICLIWLPFP